MKRLATITPQTKSAQVAADLCNVLESVICEEARRDCAYFASVVMRDEGGKRYVNGAHHERWHRFLDQHPRAVILAPVEHGKTQQIAVARTLWMLGHDPTMRCVVVSSTHLQAIKIVRAVRETIESNEWLRKVFPSLRPGAPWGEALYLAGRPPGIKDPSLQAFGVHGSILGARVDWLVLDDVCDYESTRTEHARADLLQWVRSTLLSRLTPRGRVVVIGTSWHPDDLPHVLIREGWPHIIDRAIQDDGSPLWPERWPLDRLEAKRAEIGSIEFARQFLNEPILGTQSIFRDEWIRIVDDIPPRPKQSARVRYWDLAATPPSEVSDPDWAVGVLMAASGGKYYVLDVCRLRGTPAEVETAIVRCASADGPDTPVVIEEEPGAAGKSLIDHIARRVLPGHPVYGHRHTGSKTVRAQPLAAAMERGEVLIARAPWNQALRDELVTFPHGRHDDQVDALAGAYQSVAATLGRVVTRTHGLMAR